MIKFSDFEISQFPDIKNEIQELKKSQNRAIPKSAIQAMLNL